MKLIFYIIFTLDEMNYAELKRLRLAPNFILKTYPLDKHALRPIKAKIEKVMFVNDIRYCNNAISSSQ